MRLLRILRWMVVPVWVSWPIALGVMAADIAGPDPTRPDWDAGESPQGKGIGDEGISSLAEVPNATVATDRAWRIDLVKRGGAAGVLIIDGDLVPEGGILKDGTRVERIADEEIVLQQGSRRRVLERSECWDISRDAGLKRIRIEGACPHSLFGGYLGLEWPLVAEGGGYWTEAELNGAVSGRFLVDPEASEAMIAVELVASLREKKLLNEREVLAPGKFRLPGGGAVDREVVVLRSLRFGGYEVQNIALLVAAAGEPSRLGRDLLTKLNARIDYQRHRLLLGGIDSVAASSEPSQGQVAGARGTTHLSPEAGSPP
ncbi:MAG: retropepsin-like domain-containing protein [Magnetococcales bacterium]|nr:retropepsin-like domain-containing protein [Magnetococcales bacterium]